MSKDSKDIPPIRAVAMNLFPTMGSLEEVVSYSLSRLPVDSKNEMTSILGIYHNTLLKEISNDNRTTETVLHHS